MKRFILALLAATSCAIGTSALAQTYTYTGNNYTSASGSYDTGMSVTGEFTTAAALAPNLVAQDITGLILTFTFSDGVTTITEADGALADFNTIPGATVSTDASGDIIEWSFFARDVPLATAIGEFNDIIATANTAAAVVDQGAVASQCTAVDATPSCTSYTPTSGNGAVFNSAGSWVTTLPPPPPSSAEAIPGLTGYGLALTGIGLLLLGLRRLRR